MSAGRSPEPISIWQPRRTAEGLAFVRPDPLPLGDHYAAEKVLRPKAAELPLRVCLYGESTAAGYLYAPRLTPARVLQDQLRAVGGAGNFEVIDLARTNETLGSLAETVRTSLQINPDMLVIFAGNNWNLLETPEVSPYAPSVAARQRFGQALREEGMAGPVRLAAEQLQRTAEAAFDLIGTIARTVGIPVVLLLPEVNLADWETRQPPNQKAKLEGRRDAGGPREEAARAARAEIDAAAYPTLAFLSAPQATTAVRELLRRAADRHGFFPVDLQEVFASYTGSPLPDRRLFLDYCHLTSEGMHVAMAAVAAQVLNLSGMMREDTDWQSLLPRLPAPDVSPEAEATARFGAAIHTAHRLLPVTAKGPILEHWCQAALEASPGIAAAMLDLAEARCAPCPAVLTAALRRNFASPYRLLLQHGWRWDHLDADLLEAIQAVLERRGLPVRDRIVSRLLESHGLREEGTDLAEPPYLWEPLERFYPEVMRFDDLPERATLRFPGLEASFCLVCGAGRDVDLEATLRLPSPGERRGRVRFAVNGREAGGVEAAERWSRSSLRLDRECLRPGLNRLTLCWPPPAEGAGALQAATERLEQGIAADLHPVFGEVFSLLARPVP